MRRDATASPIATSATHEKTISVPALSASAPMIGPNSSPATATPRMPPITAPRRASGAARITHVRAPAHARALETPWLKRATSSTTTLSPNPKATHDAPSKANPASRVGRGPTRAAIRPAGSEAVRVPAAKAPERTPAEAFDSPRSSAYEGRSGVIAEKNMTSRKTTVDPSRSRRRIDSS